jgi:hypothetical protein
MLSQNVTAPIKDADPTAHIEEQKPVTTSWGALLMQQFSKLKAAVDQKKALSDQEGAVQANYDRMHALVSCVSEEVSENEAQRQQCDGVRPDTSTAPTTAQVASDVSTNDTFKKTTSTIVHRPVVSAAERVGTDKCVPIPAASRHIHVQREPQLQV